MLKVSNSKQLRQLPRALAAGLVISIYCLAFGANVFAQGAGNSTITGTVVDNAGVVPGATVTLKEIATSVVRTTSSNETGGFRFAALPPGHYSLKVELQGF